jgi:hypothetical protein
LLRLNSSVSPLSKVGADGGSSGAIKEIALLDQKEPGIV